MSETKTSHVQQAQGVWKKLCDDQMARVEQFYTQVAKVEGQGVSQMTNAVAEMNKLSLDTFNYFGQLSAEWRKLSLDAAKKTTELLTPQG